MRLLLACLLLMLVTGANGQNADGDSDKREIAAFNASVSDAEIADWLAVVVQYDPVERAEWRALTPDARAKVIANHRRAFAHGNQRLFTLRGLSAEELEAFHVSMQWRGEALQSARAARLLMPTLSAEQHKLIRDTCIHEIAGYEKAPRLHKILGTPTPKALEFLRPQLVRIDSDTCDVFLAKGMGKGAGFKVRQVDGAWRLYRFDQYESWEEHEIALPGASQR